MNKLATLLDLLYGKDGEGTGTEPSLPSPDQVAAIFAAP